MNEYETNPQRHEASSPAEEPSHRSADAPRDISSPERGQSDSTTPLAPSAPHGAPAEPATAHQPVVPGVAPQSPWQGGHQ